jgi:hypothetical protein
MLLAAVPTAAQARTTSRASVTYSAGAYSGKITQVVPKPYAGHIGFALSRGKLTALTLSIGVACQGVGWVHEKASIPAVTITIGRTGTFSYLARIDRSHLRISGILEGHTAVGSVFQSLWFGHTFCSMNRPALYTASG